MRFVPRVWRGAAHSDAAGHSLFMEKRQIDLATRGEGSYHKRIRESIRLFCRTDVPATSLWLNAQRLAACGTIKALPDLRLRLTTHTMSLALIKAVKLAIGRALIGWRASGAGPGGSRLWAAADALCHGVVVDCRLSAGASHPDFSGANRGAAPCARSSMSSRGREPRSWPSVCRQRRARVAPLADSPEMATASLLVLGMAAALQWGGLPAARAMLGPWVLACLVLRLPADIDGPLAGAIDYVALVLMLLLVVSTDHVGLLFRRAVRLARPARCARSTKKTPAPATVVTVTGITLDASGQLVKVINRYTPEAPGPMWWPPETAVAAGRPACVPTGRRWRSFMACCIWHK